MQYVYRYNNGLIEALVDNPLAIINKNIETNLTSEKAEIRVIDKIYIVDITPLEINPRNLFDDIGFGSIIDYEVKDNQLIAKISSQISPAGYFGEFFIVYEYRDKMYQAKSIEFQPADFWVIKLNKQPGQETRFNGFPSFPFKQLGRIGRRIMGK